jgi:TPR repeat protein
MRAALAAAMLIGLCTGLSACTASSYAGIPLGAGVADPDLQSLARRARAGDRSAQLELGSRYEDGRGVVRDRSRAAAQYRRAAVRTTGAQQVYLPPVGKHGQGRVARIDRSARNDVSGEAHMRLARLKGDESAAAEGAGCSGLACSTGGIAPRPPIRSSLTPGEVWRRLLEAVLNGADIGTGDTARIFGIPPAAIGETRPARINLEFEDSSVHLFSFDLERRPCPIVGMAGCRNSEPLTQLSISYMGDEAAGACINNGALAERFAQAGWREPPRKRPRARRRGTPLNVGVPAFDVYFRPGFEAFASPPRVFGNRCITLLLYFARSIRDK